MAYKTIIEYAFLHALGATTYIALVATFITNVNKIIGQPDKIIGTMAFLLTLVISVAVMGLLLFARPAMWYLNGLKKEAVFLLIYTIAFLILIALLIFLMLAVKF